MSAATGDNRNAGLRNQHRRRPQIDMRDHDELHIVRLRRTRRGVPRHDLEAGIAADDRLARLRHEPDRNRRVVPDAGADAGQIQARIDSQRFQFVPRPDARAHQDRRRADSPSAESHMFGLNRASVGELNPQHSRAIKKHPIDNTPRTDGQILASARRIDMGEQGGDSRVPGPVHRPGSDTRSVRRIVVFDLRKAGGEASVVEGPLNGDEVGDAVTRDRNRTIPAVMRPRPMKVGLQTLKPRRHSGPPPVRVSEVLPGVEIRGPRP
jgi:hypothetical protein